MKILFDMVPSGRPSRCSSAAKVKTLIERLLGVRDDVFFYWLIPEWTPDEDQDWFPKHPNVTLIRHPYSKDRMREYQRFTAELDKVMAFNGDWWDYDVVVTSRTTMIPIMRATMNSPRAAGHARKLRAVIDIEEMFLMSFRPTVALSDVAAQEQMVLQGYLASDQVMFVTRLESQNVLDIARKYIAPSQVRRLMDKIVLARTASIESIELKAPEHRYVRGQRPMCVAFTGRFEQVASSLETIWDVFTNQFIMHGDQLKLLVCTVTSQNIHVPKEIPEFVEIRRPDRAAFWQAIRTEMDVLLCMHNNAEFTLSLVEPMLMGVPVVLRRQEWSEVLFGEHYPFFAKDMTEAYALIRAFSHRYDEMYEKWAAWVESHFEPMFEPGGQYGLSMYDHLIKWLGDWYAGQKAYVQASHQERNSEIVLQIAEFVKDRESFVLFDVIKEMNCFDVLEQKTRPGDRDTRRLVFSTDWNDMRVMFKHLHGWADGPKVGEFRRPK